MVVSNTSSRESKTDAIRIIKDIERRNYPYEMLQLQDCENWADVQSYSESKNVAIFIVDNCTYVLVTDDEVVDWCGRGKDVFLCLSFMSQHFNGKSFSVDLRESTSYKIAKLLQKRNKLAILKSRKWTWSKSCPEIMYNCLCQFT